MEKRILAGGDGRNWPIILENRELLRFLWDLGEEIPWVLTVGSEGKELPTWEQEFPRQVPVLNYVYDFKRLNGRRVGYRVAHLR